MNSQKQPDSFTRSLMMYFIGFLLSIILTILAFSFTVISNLSYRLFILTLSLLAVTQLFIQVRFFLHLNSESPPKWNLKAFLFMILIVLILVVGSLWIMYNLDYNMMPSDVDTYLLKEEAFIKE